MNGKISFGVDFFYVLSTLFAEDSTAITKSSEIIPILLVLEWGFSTKEYNEVHRLFNKKLNEGGLEDSLEVLMRLIAHVANFPDQKSKLLTHIMVIANLIGHLDGKLSKDKIDFIKSAAEFLGIEKNESEELAYRADDIFNAIYGFAQTNRFAGKTS